MAVGSETAAFAVVSVAMYMHTFTFTIHTFSMITVITQSLTLYVLQLGFHCGLNVQIFR